MRKEVFDFLEGNSDVYPIDDMKSEMNALEEASGFLQEISAKIMDRISGSVPTSGEKLVSLAALCHEFAALVVMYHEEPKEEVLRLLLENLRYTWREVR